MDTLWQFIPMQNKIYLWDRRSNSYLRQMYFGINLPIKKNTKILFDEKLPVPHSQLDQFYNWDNLESLKTYYIISFFL